MIDPQDQIFAVVGYRDDERERGEFSTDPRDMLPAQSVLYHHHGLVEDLAQAAICLDPQAIRVALENLGLDDLEPALEEELK